MEDEHYFFYLISIEIQTVESIPFQIILLNSEYQIKSGNARNKEQSMTRNQIRQQG